MIHVHMSNIVARDAMFVSHNYRLLILFTINIFQKKKKGLYLKQGFNL